MWQLNVWGECVLLYPLSVENHFYLTSLMREEKINILFIEYPLLARHLGSRFCRTPTPTPTQKQEGKRGKHVKVKERRLIILNLNARSSVIFTSSLKKHNNSAK